MPLDEWAAADRERWLQATAKGDILEGSGCRGHVRQITNLKIEKGYGRFLTFLSRAGFLSAPFTPEAITRSSILAYVKELQRFQNSAATIISRLQELHDALSAIFPERNWTFVRSFAAQIRSAAPASDRKRSKMVASDDLLTLGIQLIEGARLRSAARVAAIDFRDGLLIGLLTLRPMRLRNLAALILEKTVIRCGESYRISFHGTAMKNGSPFEAEWPASLLEFLREWIKVYRPILISCRNRWYKPAAGELWLSSHGSPMTRQAIYDRICTRTRDAFGHAVNPHLFRDAAATTLAIEDPKHIRLAAPLLSHRDFRVTEKYYLQARMLTATARYQAQVSKRRRSTS